MKGFWETDGKRMREACNIPNRLAEAVAKKELQMIKDRAKEKIRREWINTLPESINNGEVLIDKIMCGFTDPWGNWLIGLPQDPVENIEKWFSENFNPEFME